MSQRAPRLPGVADPCQPMPHWLAWGVRDRLDVKMIGGEGLLAKDPNVGIVCIRAALILGRARALLQKCHARGHPSTVGRPMCVDRACARAPRARVGRVRLVVGRAGGIRFSFS